MYVSHASETRLLISFFLDYTVVVKTSNSLWAGTDARVSIRVRGTTGNINDRELDSITDHFERGRQVNGLQFIVVFVDSRLRDFYLTCLCTVLVTGSLGFILEAWWHAAAISRESSRDKISRQLLAPIHSFALVFG